MYKIFSEESILEGELGINWISGEVFKEAITFCQFDDMNNQLTDIYDPLEVNQIIYVSKGSEEELTIDNITSNHSLIKEYETDNISENFERNLNDDFRYQVEKKKIVYKIEEKSHLMSMQNFIIQIKI